MKARTNVTLPRDLLAEARELRLNVSSVAEGALRSAGREARARLWTEENAEALAQRARWIEEHEMPLADLQVWRP
jgi:antitoxin CcdA